LRDCKDPLSTSTLLFCGRADPQQIGPLSASTLLRPPCVPANRPAPPTPPHCLTWTPASPNRPIPPTPPNENTSKAADAVRSTSDGESGGAQGADAGGGGVGGERGRRDLIGFVLLRPIWALELLGSCCSCRSCPVHLALAHVGIFVSVSYLLCLYLWIVTCTFLAIFTKRT
jgi:hypothetical protein